jgi:predicted methyltransferase
MINRRHFLAMIPTVAAIAAVAPHAVFGANAPKMVHASDIEVPDALSKAVLESMRRPTPDKVRDFGRKPAETMAFFGIRPAMKVADLIASTGYFTAVLAEAVGESGTVYGQNNKAMLDFLKEQLKGGNRPLANLVDNQGYKNIVELSSELDDPKLPGGLDAVFIVMIYHDVIDLDWNAKAMNKAVFNALKPGGIYGIIDHHAAPGMGISDVGKNHRIEKSFVVDEITAAGFNLAEETDLLSNPDDPLNVSVFAPDIRDRTNRFMLKFVKPA